jgi:hypothetical protein
MPTTETTALPHPPTLRRRGLRPLAAIPGGAPPPIRVLPPHDFLVLNQRPDLTPEFFPRLIRVDLTRKF